MLDPGSGLAKTGQLVAYARDDRPWQEGDLPAIVLIYAYDLKAARPIDHLRRFAGTL